MQFTTSIAATLLAIASLATAAPAAGPSTSVQITNDFSGRNVNVVVPLSDRNQPSAGQYDVATLLKGTALDGGNGVYAATSFFLQANFQNVECDVSFPGGVVFAAIDPQRDFVQIAPVSSPRNLAGSQIKCFARS